MMKNFNVAQFSVINNCAYAEASSLGIRPGQVLSWIKVAGFSYRYTGQNMNKEGDVLGWVYIAEKQNAPIRLVEIFND